MNITKEWLEEHDACPEGVEWVLEQDTQDGIELVERLRDYRFDWANWLIVRLMNKRQKVQYAINATELALPFFEEKYPNNDQPRKAIEAVKEYLDNPCEKTVAAVRDAARGTAYAAYAARATYATAYAAAHIVDDTHTANNAYAAAAYASDAEANKDAIINYGIKLLKEEG